MTDKRGFAKYQGIRLLPHKIKKSIKINAELGMPGELSRLLYKIRYRKIGFQSHRMKRASTRV